MKILVHKFSLILIALLLSNTLQGQTRVDEEVRLLIDSVAQSGCTFERNGKSYEAGDAADHLTLKFKRGKKYAKNSENFIDRLASKSSLSGKPYHIACPGQEKMTSGDWLHQKLTSLRQVKQESLRK